MKVTAATSLACAGLLFANLSFAAAYIKFDGVDGESKSSAAPQTQVQSPEKEKPAGLLLPAVQKARDAGAESEPRRTQGKVETERKVEQGRK